MMKRTMLLSATASVLLMISGCCTPVYENRYAWSDGWRVGTVTKMVPANEFLKTSGFRCRQEKIDPTDQVAIIKWRQVAHTRWHSARVGQDSGIAVGDEVYFNAWNCDQPEQVHKTRNASEKGRVP